MQWDPKEMFYSYAISLYLVMGYISLIMHNHRITIFWIQTPPLPEKYFSIHLIRQRILKKKLNRINSCLVISEVLTIRVKAWAASKGNEPSIFLHSTCSTAQPLTDSLTRSSCCIGITLFTYKKSGKKFIR